uniref:RING-type domain-containing protein n=1 Tax=Sus scrofa TaxID=9823 RepID=A0A8D0Y766_PIG
MSGDVEDAQELRVPSEGAQGPGGGKMFPPRRGTAVATWSWDVEGDTCAAVCRVQVRDDCVVAAGGRVVVECNHSFHNCCMSLGAPEELISQGQRWRYSWCSCVEPCGVLLSSVL